MVQTTVSGLSDHGAPAKQAVLVISWVINLTIHLWYNAMCAAEYNVTFQEQNNKNNNRFISLNLHWIFGSLRQTSANNYRLLRQIPTLHKYTHTTQSYLKYFTSQ